MSIDAIFPDPPVGQVGLEVGLPLKGTPDGEPRWFLREKPLGSTLALNVELAEPRFAPDAPGRYVVGVKDVTVTIPVARFEGDPLVTAPTDDEATAPETQLVYWVAETISRDVAFAKTTAKLSLSTYDDQTDETRPQLVTLTPAAGAVLGAEAVADPYVANILAEMRTATGLSTYLGPSVELMRDLWRALFAHISGTNATPHLFLDETVTPSGTPTTLAECQSLLTALAAELLAHEARVGSVHLGEVLTPLATPIGTTEADAIAYAVALDRAFVWHATTVDDASGVHVHQPQIADGAEGAWREPPYDLATLCAFTSELADRLSAHKMFGYFTVGTHLVLGSNLPNPFADGMTSQRAFAAVGQMIDVFAAHVASYQGDATPGAHTAKRAPPALTKPSDPAGVARAVETLIVELEAHGLDRAAHLGNAAVGVARVRVGTDPETSRWPYTVRLAKRLEALAGSATPPVPENRNKAATVWRVFGGWK